MANKNLLINLPTWDTVLKKFGTAALQSSAGTAGALSAPLITSGTTAFTLEGWFASTQPISSGAVVMMGQPNAAVLYGLPTALSVQYGTTSQTVSGSGAYLDGALHHFELVCGPNGGKLFLDGVLKWSIATAWASSGATFADPFAVAGTNSSLIGNLEELAVWNSEKNLTGFTPPTTAYTGAESGLLALWHMDGDPFDSSTTLPTINSANSAWTYSPGNWQVSSGRAKTINGGYFKAKFSGNSLTLNFEPGPLTPLPQIIVTVDKRVVYTGDIASTIPITMPTDTTAWANHSLKVNVKAITGANNRWTRQDAALIFQGITLAAGGTLTAQPSSNQKIMVCGDSITEGYITLGALSSPDTTNNDATVGWAYLLGELLGVEVGVVGFSSSGYIVSGSSGGQVPNFVTTCDKLFAGTARNFAGINLIVINLGTNDNVPATVTANVQTVLTNLLGKIDATARILIMKPFNGNNWSAIQAGVSAVNSPNVFLMDTSGFFNTSDSNDGLHPYGTANINQIGPLVAAQIQPILAGPHWASVVGAVNDTDLVTLYVNGAAANVPASVLKAYLAAH